MDWDDFFEKLIPLGESSDQIIDFIEKKKWYIIGGIVILVYVLATQL